MTRPDFRALCAELLDRYDLEWRARERIKEALAQPEPEGEGLTDDEITQCLLDAGVDAVEGEQDGTNRMYWEGWHDQVIRAFRVAIAAYRACWGCPAAPPAEREVGELVA